MAFVIDAYARRIVGWRVSTSPHAGFVLDALEQEVHERRRAKGMWLVHHSDRGSQYLSIKYTERLAEAGIEPSVGSVGDSYDALAETINGLFKAEVIPATRPLRSALRRRIAADAALEEPAQRDAGDADRADGPPDPRPRRQRGQQAEGGGA